MSKRPNPDSGFHRSGSNAAAHSPKRMPRGSERSMTTPPRPYRARVRAVADAEAAITGSTKGINDDGEVDAAIMQRIKKCLDKGHHPNTPEAEARAALHLASRMMGQYNVTQAKVLAHEPPEKRRQYAGQSVVSIERVDGDRKKPVKHESYVKGLCRGIGVFFDVKHYTASFDTHLDIIYYGVAQNTATAVMAFEMVYNLVNEWVRAYKGISTKNSYLLGVADSLLLMARKEKEAEEKRARETEARTLADKLATKEREEELERKMLLERSRQPELQIESDPDDDMESNAHGAGPAFSPAPDASPQSNYSNAFSIDSESYHGFSSEENSDDDSVKPDFKVEDGDLVDPFADLDVEVERLAKSDGDKSVTLEPGSAKTEERSIKGELGDGPTWASHMQLVAFRTTATQIADDYIRDKGYKLKKARKTNSTVRDREAYRKGGKDSEKIDLRRRRITGQGEGTAEH